MSKTLVEYKTPEATGQLYVQYRDELPTAVVERIELTCVAKAGTAATCDNFFNQFVRNVDLDARVFERRKAADPPVADKATVYFGAPRFVRIVEHWKPNDEFEYKVALMSQELYESAFPKDDCTSSIFGTWDSLFMNSERYVDIGRVKIERVDDNGIKGSYQKNNGTFTLKLDGPESQEFLYGHSLYKGEWKDDIGAGTIIVRSPNDVSGIAARFNRTSSGTSQKPAAPKNTDTQIPYDGPSSRYNWYGKCAP